MIFHCAATRLCAGRFTTALTVAHLDALIKLVAESAHPAFSITAKVRREARKRLYEAAIHNVDKNDLDAEISLPPYEFDADNYPPASATTVGGGPGIEVIDMDNMSAARTVARKTRLVRDFTKLGKVRDSHPFVRIRSHPFTRVISFASVHLLSHKLRATKVSKSPVLNLPPNPSVSHSQSITSLKLMLAFFVWLF